jgi:hypothetical protein
LLLFSVGGRALTPLPAYVCSSDAPRDGLGDHNGHS